MPGVAVWGYHGTMSRLAIGVSHTETEDSLARTTSVAAPPPVLPLERRTAMKRVVLLIAVLVGVAAAWTMPDHARGAAAASVTATAADVPSVLKLGKRYVFSTLVDITGTVMKFDGDWVQLKDISVNDGTSTSKEPDGSWFNLSQFIEIKEVPAP